jgi:hypothetical protein
MELLPEYSETVYISNKAMMSYEFAASIKPFSIAGI